MNRMLIFAILPFSSFLVLLMLERIIPANRNEPKLTSADWILNLSGFFIQGLIIPLLGYGLATYVFPSVIPSFKEMLPLGWIGAFLLNVIGVDLLYYIQHRAFHKIPFLWKLHAPHHYSQAVNIWVTSRNALVTHFLFVYMLVNPILGYLCDVPEGFFAGAMLTASLDLFRHANIRFNIPILNQWVIMPFHHHIHHDPQTSEFNYGANLILWDKIFHTANIKAPHSRVQKQTLPPSWKFQLLYPWRAVSS